MGELRLLNDGDVRNLVLCVGSIVLISKTPHVFQREVPRDVDNLSGVHIIRHDLELVAGHDDSLVGWCYDQLRSGRELCL